MFSENSLLKKFRKWSIQNHVDSLLTEVLGGGEGAKSARRMIIRADIDDYHKAIKGSIYRFSDVTSVHGNKKK